MQVLRLPTRVIAGPNEQRDTKAAHLNLERHEGMRQLTSQYSGIWYFASAVVSLAFIVSFSSRSTSRCF